MKHNEREIRNRIMQEIWSIIPSDLVVAVLNIGS